jgi:hypothetical protein
VLPLEFQRCGQRFGNLGNLSTGVEVQRLADASVAQGVRTMPRDEIVDPESQGQWDLTVTAVIVSGLDLPSNQAIAPVTDLPPTARTGGHHL